MVRLERARLRRAIGKRSARRARGGAPGTDPGRPIDVTVVLVDGGYASTAIGPIEVFHSAGVLWNMLKGLPQEPGFRVTVASPRGRPVKTVSGNLGLSPECAMEDIERTDIVVIPASGIDVQPRIVQQTLLLSWLRTMHERGAYLASVCSGAAFLAEAGLLDGREATTHWALVEVLRERYPKVRWRPEQFVTEDRRILCSGGVYASLDISLYMVEKFCGHEVALQCAKSLLLGLPRSHQSGYSVLPLSRPHSDERIRKAEECLREHFPGEIGIEGLAELCAMSPRNFVRRFKAATGRMPGEYLQLMRITAARELLEGDPASVQEISERVGYADASFFRTVFKRHTGMTPVEYRERFGPLRCGRGPLAAGAAG